MRLMVWKVWYVQPMACMRPSLGLHYSVSSQNTDNLFFICANLTYEITLT